MPLTDERLRRVYDAGRKSVRASGRADYSDDKLGKMLDIVIAYGDQRQAGLLDWAMDNGYPEFETMVRYGSTK